MYIFLKLDIYPSHQHLYPNNYTPHTTLYTNNYTPHTNTSVKTTEKLNKINTKTWKSRLSETTTVPVVMGVLSTIKKDMDNYTNKISGNINIHELQKVTLLFTAHLLRRVLSIKWKPSLPHKVHGLDSEVQRENHSQLH